LDPGIGYLVTLLLALLFARAVWHKVRAPAEFRATLAAYRMLPASLAAAAAVAVIVAEGTVAFGLWTAATRPVAATLAVLLLLAYALGMEVNLRRGRVDLDCGCVGPAERRPIARWMVWRNLVLALVAGALLLPFATRELGSADLVTVIGGAAALAALYGALDTLCATVAPKAALLRREK
jgi:hypothetical protein